VLRVEERVRGSAQRISTDNDALLWAESYDRKARDALELQAELAQAIAAEIQANLARTRSRSR
jgi:TolB-like protein